MGAIKNVVICGNIIGKGTGITNLNYNTIFNAPDLTVRHSTSHHSGRGVNPRFSSCRPASRLDFLLHAFEKPQSSNVVEAAEQPPR